MYAGREHLYCDMQMDDCNLYLKGLGLGFQVLFKIVFDDSDETTSTGGIRNEADVAKLMCWHELCESRRQGAPTNLFCQ